MVEEQGLHYIFWQNNQSYIKSKFFRRWTTANERVNLLLILLRSTSFLKISQFGDNQILLPQFPNLNHAAFDEDSLYKFIATIFSVSSNEATVFGETYVIFETIWCKSSIKLTSINVSTWYLRLWNLQGYQLTKTFFVVIKFVECLCLRSWINFRL